MNIQLRTTQEIEEFPVICMELTGKARNLLKRLGCNTVSDVIAVWDDLDKKKGVGEGTKNQIQNAVVNLMIQKLPDAELVEWMTYLVDNNPAEEVMRFAKKLEEKVAA